MTYQPRNDRVLIAPREREEVTAGGILIPETADKKPDRGTVLAVGPGRTLDDGTRWPVAVVPGDEVLFGRYAGTDIDDLVIVRESDILAVIEAA